MNTEQKYPNCDVHGPSLTITQFYTVLILHKSLCSSVSATGHDYTMGTLDALQACDACADMGMTCSVIVQCANCVVFPKSTCKTRGAWCEESRRGKSAGRGSTCKVQGTGCCVSGLLYCRVYSLLKHHSAFTVAVDPGVTSMEM